MLRAMCKNTGMSQINWNESHEVYMNREFSIALVKIRDGYMELDDYREDGGQAIKTLPPYSEYVGTFTNAEISSMEYPE